MDSFEDFVTSLGYWGPAGGFLASFLDSFMLPLIHVVDLLVVARGAAGDRDAWWFAAGALTGSLSGSWSLFWLSRKGRRIPLLRGLPQDRLQRLTKRLDRYPAAVLFAAAAIPAPFPFKALVIAAGVTKLDPWSFVVAIGTGRAIRYFGLTWVGERYGNAILEVVRAVGWPLLWGIVIVIVIAATWSYWKRRRATAGVGAESMG